MLCTGESEYRELFDENELLAKRLREQSERLVQSERGLREQSERLEQSERGLREQSERLKQSERRVQSAAGEPTLDANAKARDASTKVVVYSKS